MHKHFSHTLSLTLFSQLLILRSLDLMFFDFSFDRYKNGGRSFVYFRFSFLPTFIRSFAAPTRYSVLFSFVPPSKQTLQSILLLWEFLEMAASTSNIESSCSKSHRKLVGTDERCVAVFQTYSICWHLSTGFRTIFANALVPRSNVACKKHCYKRSKSTLDWRIQYKEMRKGLVLWCCTFSEKFDWEIIVYVVRLLSVVFQEELFLWRKIKWNIEHT